MRLDRRRRSGHAERHEALCRFGLRQVRRSLEPGRSRLRRCYALRAAADGELKAGATSVKAGKLGELKVINGSEILLGSPFVFTKDNINNFDF